MTSVLPQGDINPMKRCNTSIMPTRETNVAQLQGFYWPRYVTLPTSSSSTRQSEKVKPVKTTRPRKNSFSKERKHIEACLKLLPKTSLDFDLLATALPQNESFLPNRVLEERQPQHSYAWNPVSRRDTSSIKPSKPVSRLVPVKVSKKHSQRKGLRRSEKRPSVKG
mmetsp:Transcript_28604/g.69295  ORF Transcript_28604/g.69295 Transcript_28604/m.69295 type:complete len:166 (+) Transcript_28604:222-719(+)|eukprot:CAMPEP_0113631850 /NCGR_PEP_ID=MMETSP0017_2-20120614/16550_1 /TAXON_ID=2856 /ORGANISM="Cylindrotheca closterium" /LENGTH=165 /DNA_ID=CAMNT_0000542373 /DNA_START=104 /DNA_END=601 /DNA_ORIENTATION=+ /assembly_acc=CAM_ASM_000147